MQKFAYISHFNERFQGKALVQFIWRPSTFFCIGLSRIENINVLSCRENILSRIENILSYTENTNPLSNDTMLYSPWFPIFYSVSSLY